MRSDYRSIGVTAARVRNQKIDAGCIDRDAAADKIDVGCIDGANAVGMLDVALIARPKQERERPQQERNVDAGYIDVAITRNPARGFDVNIDAGDISSSTR